MAEGSTFNCFAVFLSTIGGLLVRQYVLGHQCRAST